MMMFAVGASVLGAAPSLGQQGNLAGDNPVICDPSDAGKCMCNGVPIGPSTWRPPPWLASNHTSIFQTSAPIKGASTRLSSFSGAKATIVVNVASA